MILRDDLNEVLASLLNPGNFKDYCPNGLQVEGTARIKKIISGVTACTELIDRAIEAQADAIIVHHGFFWKGEDPCIRDIKHRRLKQLLSHDINLYAYHLPLDCHLTLGNNVQLAKQLEITQLQSHAVDGIDNLLWQGELNEPLSGDTFAKQIEKVLGRKPLWIKPYQYKEIKTLAWCTGGAQKYISNAHSLKVDCYLSGEVSESTFHFARDASVHYFACGHHASERYGVKALGEYLAKEYSLVHEFIDIDNPV